MVQELDQQKEIVEQKANQLAFTEQSHQQQLREINLLFDENAQNYEVIDFSGRKY